MTRRWPRTCSESGCAEPPFLGGLCKRHHEEDEYRRRLRDDALQLLHHRTIDGCYPNDPALRTEIMALWEKWDRVCWVVQLQREHPTIPLDRAEYVTEWCIALAQQLVLADRARRAGQQPPPSLDATRQWVGEQFRHLEQEVQQRAAKEPAAAQPAARLPGKELGR